MPIIDDLLSIVGYLEAEEGIRLYSGVYRGEAAWATNGDWQHSMMWESLPQFVLLHDAIVVYDPLGSTRFRFDEFFDAIRYYHDQMAKQPARTET